MHKEAPTPYGQDTLELVASIVCAPVVGPHRSDGTGVGKRELDNALLFKELMERGRAKLDVLGVRSAMLSCPKLVVLSGCEKCAQVLNVPDHERRPSRHLKI